MWEGGCTRRGAAGCAALQTARCGRRGRSRRTVPRYPPIPPPPPAPTRAPHPTHPQQERLLDRLAAAQRRRLPALPLRTTAGLVLALVNAGYYEPAFFADAAAAALRGLGGLEPWEAPVVVTALAAGFSAAGHYEPRLFEGLATKVRARRTLGAGVGGVTGASGGRQGHRGRAADALLV